jgi:hypothetical protein
MSKQQREEINGKYIRAKNKGIATITVKLRNINFLNEVIPDDLKDNLASSLIMKIEKHRGLILNENRKNQINFMGEWTVDGQDLGSENGSRKVSESSGGQGSRKTSELSSGPKEPSGPELKRLKEGRMKILEIPIEENEEFGDEFGDESSGLKSASKIQFMVEAESQPIPQNEPQPRVTSEVDSDSGKIKIFYTPRSTTTLPYFDIAFEVIMSDIA